MHGNIKCCWIQIGNHLIDATPIMEEHPGGSRLLRAMHLKDATTAFYSGANMHTKTAQRLASRLRIACFASNDEQVSRMRSQ
jgi:cytochrome b involved in lipid metabolism